MNDTTNVSARAPQSAVLHSMAGYYDLLAGLLTLGRECEFRERLAVLANLGPGESVLDVGCGTGSLAVVAKRRVAESGIVRGVDASPEMIERARHKAAKARLDIAFDVARAEALPFPDASFDVVMSTLMMHHLPRTVRELLAAEIRRVLRPGGRVLVVDFEKPANKRGGLIARFHRHGGVPLRDIIDLLRRYGLQVIETGSVGVADLRFALARQPREGDGSIDPPPATERSLPPLRVTKWIVPFALVVAVAAHLVVLGGVRAALALGTLTSVGVLVFVLAHVGFAGGVSAMRRRHRRRES